MPRFGTSYQTCNRLQKTLLKSIMDAETKARDVVFCVEQWVNLEYFKREIRGIPRLKPAGLRDVLDAHMKRAKRADAPAMVEADIVAETPGG